LNKNLILAGVVLVLLASFSGLLQTNTFYLSRVDDSWPSYWSGLVMNCGSQGTGEFTCRSTQSYLPSMVASTCFVQYDYDGETFRHDGSIYLNKYCDFTVADASKPVTGIRVTFCGSGADCQQHHYAVFGGAPSVPASPSGSTETTQNLGFNSVNVQNTNPSQKSGAAITGLGSSLSDGVASFLNWLEKVLSGGSK